MRKLSAGLPQWSSRPSIQFAAATGRTLDLGPWAKLSLMPLCFDNVSTPIWSVKDRAPLKDRTVLKNRQTSGHWRNVKICRRLQQTAAGRSPKATFHLEDRFLLQPTKASQMDRLLKAWGHTGQFEFIQTELWFVCEASLTKQCCQGNAC